MKIAALLLALLICALLLQAFVVVPFGPNDQRIAGFYKEPEDSLDIVLIGSSDIIYGFSPCLAYKEYGYTSYLFSCVENTVGLWKIQMDEAMRTQNPSCIVVEVNGALYTDENVKRETNLRLFTNNMPKEAGFNELLSLYSDLYQPNERITFYLPYIKYHSNIPLRKRDFDQLANRLDFNRRGESLFKGDSVNFKQPKKSDTVDLSSDDTALPLREEQEAFLRFTLENARQKGLPLLFIRAPHRIDRDNERNIERTLLANRVGEIVNEYGYDLINYDRLHGEIGIDDKVDFASREHLNYHGMQKFTRVLSEELISRGYLSEKAHPKSITDRWDRSVRLYDQWMKDALEAHEGQDRSKMDLFYENESAALLKKLERELGK